MLIVFLVLFIACNQSINNKKVEDAMRKYDDRILHTDAKGISEMFTTDGKMAPKEMNPIVGRDGIQKFLEQFKGVTVKEQTSATDSIRSVGDTAYQYGKYHQVAIVNNTTADIHGMYEAKWVLQKDGTLLLQRMSAWSGNN